MFCIDWLEDKWYSGIYAFGCELPACFGERMQRMPERGMPGEMILLGMI